MPDYQIAAILEADRVERFLAGLVRPVGHADIASATGIAGAKLTRILASLKTCGRVEEPADGRFGLCPDFLTLFAQSCFEQFARRSRDLVSQIDAILERNRPETKLVNVDQFDVPTQQNPPLRDRRGA